MASTKSSRKRKKRESLRQRAAVRQQSGGSPGGNTESGLDPRLEKALRKAEKEHLKQERAERAAQEQAALESARSQAARVREDLAAEELALHDRERLLRKDLPPRQDEQPRGVLQRIRAGAAKTRDHLTGGMARLVLGKREFDTDVLDGLEELLYSADVGTETTERLLTSVRGRVQRKELRDPQRLTAEIREEVRRIMRRNHPPLKLDRHRPTVVLMAGVNGSGKTTTIGKLAASQIAAGHKVLVAAGDTFRAAATEQLEGWSRQVGFDLVSRAAGADPSAVIYETVEKGIAGDYGLVLCDTAGRLHTKVNLMEELKKIKRVMSKLIPEAPHETFLVLDANTGQNAILQTREFHKAIELTGLIVTKLDGTARGGVVVGIVNEFDLPIRFIGVGEGVDDLQPFDAEIFAESLFA